MITGRFEFRADVIRARGVERIINVFLAEVPRDSITVWVAVPDFTDLDTSRFFAPPEATPADRFGDGKRRKHS